MRAQDRYPGNILVLGDINVDIIGRVKAWPEPGDDCLAPRLEMHCGGVGANCALALARWGVPTRILGCVGRDQFGDFMLGALRKNGVNVRSVQRTDDAMTGMVYINVTPDGQRTFFGSRGANRVTRLQGNGVPLLHGAAAALLMGYSFLDPGPERAALKIIRAIRARGGWISLDAGQGPSKDVPRKILRASREVDILFAGGEEAAALVGTRDPRKALAALERTGARHVVLKLGKRGCLIRDAGALRQVPAFRIRAVDSTGAGDAFVAAFLQGRLRGWTMAEAALVANAAGAAAATFVGAGTKLPGPREVNALMEKQRCDAEWNEVRARVLERLCNEKNVRRRPP